MSSDAGPLTLHAPAKVNLFLRILAREEGGYHQIETLFQLLEFGDDVTLELVDTPGIELEMEGAEAEGLGPPEQNLAVRAARAFLDAAAQDEPLPATGVRVILKKRIPHGAGLGGGSSDAAAVLRGLNRLSGTSLPPRRLLELAAELGADVPSFLSPSPTTLAWGRGDRLLPLPPLPPARVVLALPPIRVATQEAYRLLAEWRAERRAGGARPGPSILDPASLAGWGGVTGAAGNDFHSPIFHHRPELGELCRGLEETGAGMALLSGSGAALFGVFPTEGAAAAAVTTLEERFPDVRFLATRTRGAASGEAAGGT